MPQKLKSQRACMTTEGPAEDRILYYNYDDPYSVEVL